MAYSITTTAGQTLATIADGTVNTTTTSLTLIGKNYAGYGLFLNENYIKLLENFSNGIPPSSALQGQLWYDSGANILKVYSGSIWKPISSSATGSTQPVNPVLGDLWWDTANAQLKVWSGSAWIVVGPAYTTSSGTSGAIVETILDNTGNSHTVVRFYISNVTMAILSNDPVFTPLTAIAGFTTIKPGFNLVSASTVANSQYSGIAENSVKLNGLESSAFIRGDQPIDVEYTITAGGGLVVGEDLTINGNVTNTATEIKNLVGNHNMDFYVKSGATDRKALAIAGATGNVTLSSNLLVTGGIITTAATTSTLFDTATTVNIGASTGNTIVKNNLQVVGENIITTAAAVSFANTTTTSMQIGSAATAITMGSPAGVVTARGDLAVNGGDITTTASTFNLLNSTATTLNIGQAATSLVLGATTGTANIRNATTNIIGAATVGGNLAVAGNSSLTGTLAVSGLSTLNSLNSPGTITQTNYVRVDTKLTYVVPTYAAAVNLPNGIGMDGLDITITPKFANSKILIQYCITYETVNDSAIFLLERRVSGGANTFIGRNVNDLNNWSGVWVGNYDGDWSSTPNTQTMFYYDTPGTTSPITYRIYAQSSNRTTFNIYINRAYANAGAANFEVGISQILVQEICQ